MFYRGTSKTTLSIFRSLCFWHSNKWANFSPVCSTSKRLCLRHVWEHFLQCTHSIRQNFKEETSKQPRAKVVAFFAMQILIWVPGQPVFDNRRGLGARKLRLRKVWSSILLTSKTSALVLLQSYVLIKDHHLWLLFCCNFIPVHLSFPYILTLKFVYLILLSCHWVTLQESECTCKCKCKAACAKPRSQSNHSKTNHPELIRAASGVGITLIRKMKQLTTDSNLIKLALLQSRVNV